MKVLFAVNNEKVSESVIKKYQSTYKEIISAKNVYYFNAIIKELQRDKSYDRIVISEDLEPFSNKNYDIIDKFLFEKLDSISDEASNSDDGEIPIILICTDRREKGEPILLKMFSIGIYSALIGNDRTIENVCDLINKPRNKKEAKAYYNIDSDSVGYKSEKSEDVSETEIQNIINHYKKLGKNEEKYVESFNSIASQYTEGQLKVIVRFLPLNVRAVLEEKCEKYQQLMLGSVKGQVDTYKSVSTKDIKNNKSTYKPNDKKKGPSIDLIENQLSKPRMRERVVIPGTVDTSKVKRVYAKAKEESEDIMFVDQPMEENVQEDVINNIPEEPVIAEMTEVTEPVKRGRGRPPKPKTETAEETPKKKRGRPRKVVEPEVEDILEEIDNVLPGVQEEPKEDVNLFDLGNEIEDVVEENDDVFIQDDSATLPGLDEDFFADDLPPRQENDIFVSEPEPIRVPETPNTDITNVQNSTEIDISRLLTGDKKIVSFIGTSKNGTSFIVNNLAAMLSEKGIKTAILDLTKNKNAYYIYTQNDENLRMQSSRCINELRIGNPSGINISKNLTVYTTLPNEDEGLEDYSKVLETLAKNYSLVLLDCDFETNYNYFAACQEIYLVQTYDILTIQPLTAFLRELADRNILDENKLRVVINKALKVRNLNEKMIIGGLSSYNNPDMTYMKNLFNKDTIQYVTLPFEDQTYAKYLEGLVTCEISLSGYSKGLLEALSKLSDMVYPLISGRPQYGKAPNYNDYNRKGNARQFNEDTYSTLDKMRRNY